MTKDEAKAAIKAFLAWHAAMPPAPDRVSDALFQIVDDACADIGAEAELSEEEMETLFDGE